MDTEFLHQMVVLDHFHLAVQNIKGFFPASLQKILHLAQKMLIRTRLQELRRSIFQKYSLSWMAEYHMVV